MLMARSARLLRATLALPVEMQPPLFMLMPRVSVPLAPAVKVMAFVPWPAVMLPLVIDQAYVVPAGPAGIEAVWLGEPAVAVAGAEVAAVALLAIVLMCEDVPMQQAPVAT